MANACAPVQLNVFPALKPVTNSACGYDAPVVLYSDSLMLEAIVAIQFVPLLYEPKLQFDNPLVEFAENAEFILPVIPHVMHVCPSVAPNTGNGTVVLAVGAIPLTVSEAPELGAGMFTAPAELTVTGDHVGSAAPPDLKSCPTDPAMFYPCQPVK